MPTNARELRPTVEDYLRALGYINLGTWAVLFFVFPPSAFLSELAEVSRLIWLGVAFLGAAMATLGAFMRIDIKLEFPGILLGVIGPVFYTVSQFFFVVQPPIGVDPSQRIALTAYALLPVTLLLPRAVTLLIEKNRLKGLSQ